MLKPALQTMLLTLYPGTLFHTLSLHHTVSRLSLSHMTSPLAMYTVFIHGHHWIPRLLYAISLVFPNFILHTCGLYNIWPSHPYEPTHRLYIVIPVTYTTKSSPGTLIACQGHLFVSMGLEDPCSLRPRLPRHVAGHGDYEPAVVMLGYIVCLSHPLSEPAFSHICTKEGLFSS